MFKQKIAGAVTLAALATNVKAAKYRPIEGTQPWHKPASLGEIVDPEHKINYFIPNFGQDTEIRQSLANTDLAEAEKGTKMVASFKQPKGHPVDYFVPNHGVDSDILVSQGNLKQAEASLGKWTPPSAAQVKAGKYPQNYFVPNFGVDHEIATSLAHTNAAEKAFGKWTPPTKAQVKAGKYPQNYVVPNFGLDHDILTTQNNIANAQTALKHNWVPSQDKNGFWNVPAPSVNRPVNALLQTESEVKTESDPTCSSAGCNYASEKGPAGHPMNYFVPNFGADH